MTQADLTTALEASARQVRSELDSVATTRTDEVGRHGSGLGRRCRCFPTHVETRKGSSGLSPRQVARLRPQTSTSTPGHSWGRFVQARPAMRPATSRCQAQAQQATN